MNTRYNWQNVGSAVLCIVVFALSVALRVPEAYGVQAYYFVAAIQFGIVALTAWKLGANAITAPEEGRRTLAAAGGLLFVPFGIFSFVSSMGVPGSGQTPAQEQFRYLVLLTVSITVTAGLIFLREALRQAGETFYSTLGFIAIFFAAPLYLLFTLAELGAYHRSLNVGSTQAPQHFGGLGSILLSLVLFFGSVLTYLATAAFAAALGRIKWIGHKATFALVIASLFGFICLTLRGLDFPDPQVAFHHWYTILGWIAGIPAVPWLIPCMLGVVLLRRVRHERP